MDQSLAGILEPAPISPYEEAYRQAPIIVLARVVSFDPARDVLVEVVKTVRGESATGRPLYLQGTSRFPFLNAPGAIITVFVQNIAGDEATLWGGATTGGILRGDPDILDLIAAAYAEPETSLQSIRPRERLAAAYYLATQGKVDEAYRDQVIESLIWGLAQDAPETNQAALDALGALDIDVEGIAGPYHPGFRPALKREAARNLEAWRAKTPSPSGGPGS
jgi:hypothetical protein